MSAGEYKSYKSIRKENLRDNMTDLEVAITNIDELATRAIAKNENRFTHYNVFKLLLVSQRDKVEKSTLLCYNLIIRK